MREMTTEGAALSWEGLLKWQKTGLRAAIDVGPAGFREVVALQRSEGARGAFAASAVIRNQMVIVKPVAGLPSPAASVAVAHIRASWQRIPSRAG
jgi:hypothetical protein